MSKRAVSSNTYSIVIIFSTRFFIYEFREYNILSYYTYFAILKFTFYKTIYEKIRDSVVQRLYNKYIYEYVFLYLKFFFNTTIISSYEVLLEYILEHYSG